MKVLVYSNSCKNRKYYKQHIAISLVKEGVIDIYVLYINNWNHKKLSRKFILHICNSPFQLGRLLFVDASTKNQISRAYYFTYIDKLGVLE